MSTPASVKAAQRKLFGTDGIRGVAGEYPLDARTTWIIGRALGRYIQRAHMNARVVIGEDTRESSSGIAESVAAGLISTGVNVERAGVITTPGVAYLARTGNFAAGVVISASHNPWTDNGIKIFGHDGFKFPDSAELEIEQEIFDLVESGAAPRVEKNSEIRPSSRLHDAYVRWLAAHWTARNGHELKLVADCANGAASAIAPEVFAACGLASEFTHAQPNGRNINEQCGALHPEVVGREVTQRRAQIGATFDGDADRCLFADAKGNVVNGDAVLLLVARHMKTRGELRGDIVVATTMSNMGLEAALRRCGIRMLRAAVGDKYVLEEMRKTGAVLGGEQSGHIIFLDGESTTGDGLLTALRVLQIVVESGKSLAELISDLKVFPQVIKNVRVREKRPLDQIPEVTKAIRAAEQQLDGNGRVVVRYSGTEPVARVMVEAEHQATVTKYAESISAAIQESLG